MNPRLRNPRLRNQRGREIDMDSAQPTEGNFAERRSGMTEDLMLKNIGVFITNPKLTPHVLPAQELAEWYGKQHPDRQVTKVTVHEVVGVVKASVSFEYTERSGA